MYKINQSNSTDIACYIYLKQYKLRVFKIFFTTGLAKS